MHFKTTGKNVQPVYTLGVYAGGRYVCVEVYQKNIVFVVNLEV